MKNIFFMLTLFAFIPLFSFADTTEYKIKGMTCQDCVDSIKETTCHLDGIEKCDVKVGSLTITTKTGKTLSKKQVAEAVGKAGRSYRIIGEKKQP
jgi:copper chaperone CopZ